MKGTIVFKLNESVVLENGDSYAKDDIVSAETIDEIMIEYYEVSFTVIKIQ